MNSEFSDRIKDINGHAEGSKDQKRVVIAQQGSRGDDSDSN
ncbi:6729_t:CDS:2 [Rhizophagus irregularis]|nr:6729_t:CDS:2 [Rhizophagus irregularis]